MPKTTRKAAKKPAANFVSACVSIIILSLLQACAQSSQATVRPPSVFNIGSPQTGMAQHLKDFEVFRVGMTRWEVDALITQFPRDGGISTPWNLRLTHLSDHSLKIDIDLEITQRDPADHDRAVVGRYDKVIRVSKPYVQRPFDD